MKIVKEVKRGDSLWRFACGDVFCSKAQYLVPLTFRQLCRVAWRWWCCLGVVHTLGIVISASLQTPTTTHQHHQQLPTKQITSRKMFPGTASQPLLRCWMKMEYIPTPFTPHGTPNHPKIIAFIWQTRRLLWNICKYCAQNVGTISCFLKGYTLTDIFLAGNAFWSAKNGWKRCRKSWIDYLLKKYDM